MPSHVLQRPITSLMQPKQTEEVSVSRDEEKLQDDAMKNHQDPPNGGVEAWLTVLGGFVATFFSFGFLNGFAAFQDYYYSFTLRGHSNSDIAWIGSIQVLAILSSNLVLGPAFDRYGPRPILIGALILFVFGCMMTSISKRYYQFMLAQGVVVGWGMGFAFITPVACAMQWFTTRRPAALGIVISGSSFGGILWPIITLQLLQRVGLAWTWRIIGFIGLTLLPIAIFTVRLPPHIVAAKRVSSKQRPKLALDAFKTPKYSIYVVAYALFSLGLFPPLFFFPELQGRYGVSKNLQFYGISILNAFSFIGRIGLPAVAQRLGTYNVTITCIFLCGVVCFSCMAIQSGAGALVAAGAYGFTSGGALSLAISCVPAIIPDFSRLGASMGQIFFIASIFGMLSGPICGWIIGTKQDGNWIGMEGLSGAALVLSSILLVCIRRILQPDWRKLA